MKPGHHGLDAAVLNPVSSALGGARDGMRPLRVLLTTPITSGRGGVTHYLNAIRPHFQNDVQYFTIGRRSDDESAITTALRMVTDSWQFSRAIRRGSFDLVHLNPSILPKSLVRDGILLLLAKLHRKPVLVFAHGWNPAWDDRTPRYLPAIFKFVYNRADALIVLGERFKQKARQLGYTKQIIVAGAPVADELLEDEAEPAPAAPVSKSQFNILFLARVEKEKGIYETLDTFSLLKTDHPSVTLTVAGAGSELGAAQEYASARGLRDISFTGHIGGAERRRAFQRANAYLFPSHYEGLPLSVLEAMAMGVPIVTTNVGGLPDFFENGRMGFITDSRSPEALASSLAQLVSDANLCRRIRQLNRNYARMHFTAGQIATGIERVYRILSERADPTLLPAE